MALLVSVGVSHRTAPLPVRERLALTTSATDALLGELTSHPGIAETVVLATCNRTEVHLATDDPRTAQRVVLRALGRRAGLGSRALRRCVHVRHDDDAVRHLFAVAAGLDSMVPGEAQILGQLRRAHEQGATGPVLDDLFAAALRAGRLARERTGIGRGGASVSSVAVELATEALGDLRGRSVLVVGAGDSGELTARTLLAAGARVSVLATRRSARAEALAERCGAGVALSDLASGLDGADLVLCATGAPHPVIRSADIEARGGRPLVIVDLALPRDVDPAVRALAGVTLFDLDDVQRRVAGNVGRRRAVIADATEVVAREAARFARRRAEAAATPEIAALHRAAARVVADVLHEHEERWESASDADRRRVARLGEAVAGRLLDEPTRRLREAAAAPPPRPRPRRARRVAVLGTATFAACLVVLAAGALQPAAARNGGARMAPLDSLQVPGPSDEATYIRDKLAAVKLGKALFWDMQAGSDGETACASCHFNAGADNRSRNQLSPGANGSLDIDRPNAPLEAGDFPFTSDDIAGSQGVTPSAFGGIVEGAATEGRIFGALDPTFHFGGVDVRRTTGRNTPSAVNAVFFFRNFWDGRAQNDFNGVNPFGARDTGARVARVTPGGSVEQVAVSIENSSLASQAVGPPGNPVEMSSNGRTLSDIGHKLVSLRPLGSQKVARTDSVLGGDAHDSGRGLNVGYDELIRQAFRPEWWDSTTTLAAANGRRYPLMQFNFSLFWGLAIQAYESSLVSGKTPVDEFLSGKQEALSDQAKKGMSVFNGKGSCGSCHQGALLSDASALDVQGDGPIDFEGVVAADTGFHNIGVRPTSEDIGNANNDPFGNPLSITLLQGQPNPAVGGSFKTPGLRNVALTAPYFHNGGKLTLHQVVDFYNRGGDFANPEKSGDIVPLGLSQDEQDALVVFLESLTDPRVRDHAAPFDHPQLFVPAGTQTNEDGSVRTVNGRGVDCFKEVPATGAEGGAALARFPDFTDGRCDDPNALDAAPAAPETPSAPAEDSGAASAPLAPRAPAGTCVVPRLRGRTITGARRALRRVNCKLGTVARARRGRGRIRILRQSPAPGARKPAGWGVAVRLHHVRPRR